MTTSDTDNAMESEIARRRFMLPSAVLVATMICLIWMDISVTSLGRLS
jgi:hypothetical protein